MRLRALAQAGLIVLLSVALFDLIAYQLLPRTFDGRVPGYRQAASASDLIIGGRGSYPKNYFVANASRGFDIGADRKARHYIQEIGFYDIWANELGCFDQPVSSGDLDRGFLYLAGDSFTWGYVPLAEHFGTLLEHRIGRRVLKCGVTHTGQAHQLEKFKEILTFTGRLPQIVIVNYYANDVANDFAHPHSTVIDGWQIDDVGLKPPEQLIPLDPEMLRQKIRDKLADQLQDPRAPSQWLRRHSISYHLFLRLTGEHEQKKKRRRSAAYRSIYDLYPLSGEHPFLRSVGAQNREQLLQWKAHSASTGYRLLIALIPPASQAKNTGYYRDLRDFLQGNEIEHADFSEYLRQSDIAEPDSLYWPSNQHLNTSGHRIYSAFLLEVMEKSLAPGSLAGKPERR